MNFIEIYFNLFFTILKSFWYMWIIIFAFYIIPMIFYYIKYKKSNYKYESGISYFKFYFDKGFFGEGLTFMNLEKIPHYGKIMTNLYLPTEDGTTEIDLIYICKRGIYVIESKNYSGWIFGSQNSNNWTTIIYNYKQKFFNPIWQNKKHIKYLKPHVDVPLSSLIVFSERCELKKLNYDSSNTKILSRKYLVAFLLKELDKDEIITKEKIDEIYNNVKKFNLVSIDEKKAHIEKIKKYIKE